MMEPEKVIRKLYAFSSVHRKEYPADGKLLESFKKELMEDYQKIKFIGDESSPEYKGYIKHREDFLSKYHNKKMLDLFEKFRQDRSKLGQKNK